MRLEQILGLRGEERFDWHALSAHQVRFRVWIPANERMHAGNAVGIDALHFDRREFVSRNLCKITSTTLSLYIFTSFHKFTNSIE